MRTRIAVAAALSFLAAGSLLSPRNPAESAAFPARAVLAGLARDEPGPILIPKPIPPPPGPGYCGPSSDGAAAPYPPNAVFGLLTGGGVDAPAGTLVTLMFDGLPGPSAYTAAAGGYRVDYAAGGQGHEPRCINEVGSEIGLLINGVFTASRVTVGPAAGLALRFDVAIP